MEAGVRVSGRDFQVSLRFKDSSLEQTALFILSLKETAFLADFRAKSWARMRKHSPMKIVTAGELIDKLSLHTVKAFQKARPKKSFFASKKKSVGTLDPGCEALGRRPCACR